MNIDSGRYLGNNPNNNNNNINMNPNQQQQIDFTNFLQHANHPFIVLFTLLFKAGSIVS
jgi:hypothetical protein